MPQVSSTPRVPRECNGRFQTVISPDPPTTLYPCAQMAHAFTGGCERARIAWATCRENSMGDVGARKLGEGGHARRLCVLDLFELVQEARCTRAGATPSPRGRGNAERGTNPLSPTSVAPAACVAWSAQHSEHSADVWGTWLGQSDGPGQALGTPALAARATHKCIANLEEYMCAAAVCKLGGMCVCTRASVLAFGFENRSLAWSL